MKKPIMLLSLSLFLAGCQTGENNTDDTPDDQDTTEEVEDNEDNNEESEQKDETDQEDTEEETDTTDYDNIKVSVQDAFDVFTDKYPDANINEIELELENGSYEYELEGYEGDTEYELTIDAFSKEILDEDEDNESDERGKLEKDQLDDVEKYVKEALDDAGSDYWVDEWELKVKDDYIKFDIDLKTDNDDKLEYRYNYETGELLEKE